MRKLQLSILSIARLCSLFLIHGASKYICCLLLIATTNLQGSVLPLSPTLTETSVATRDSLSRGAEPDYQPGEEASKVAMIAAIAAVVLALLFAVVGFQSRLALAGLFLFACVVGLIASLIALARGEKKSRIKRRARKALLIILGLMGLTVILTLAELGKM
jgi:uncharacterized membrane protein YphA (DoxX/SURF4 family)